MGWYIRSVDRLNEYVLYFLCVLFGAMTIITIMEVVLRSIFHFSISWSEELARCFMIYTVFIGSAYCFRYKRLMAVEIVQINLPIKLRKIVEGTVYSIIILFYILLSSQGIKLMVSIHSQLSPTLRIPMSFIYASVIIGSILMLLNGITLMLKLREKEENLL